MSSHNKFRFRVIDKTSVDQYLRNKNVDKLRDNIMTQIGENGLECVDLVSIAKINPDSANLIKELVISNQIDNTELANQIAKEIISKIELEVDSHLEKYQKFTLNAQEINSNQGDDLKAQFFNLISLLKDVSVLGRKLLEMAPHFNSQKSPTLISLIAKERTPLNSPGISIAGSSNCDNKSIHSAGKSSLIGRKFINEEDATSEDLLAALIESSSTDDFLVLSSSLDTIQAKDMIMAALIYIKSHECFTLSHDIQGVAMVLRRIKFIILNILAPKNQVELITKLLTSIGRYGEMNYVFDLFRDRNQFEVLLSKGVEKTPELRIALFNYVKKNPEFYALVTLNFSMFREIAESLEANALKRLDKIKSTKTPKPKLNSSQQNKRNKKEIEQQQVHPQNNKDEEARQTNTFLSTTTTTTTTTTTGGCGDAGELQQKTATNQQQLERVPYSRESLNLCLVELVDASDCYAKAGCYKKSNNCQRKAKLVALQIALLEEGLNVLDVKEAELTDLITSFASFYEASIVAEAYDCRLAWRQALFKQVILNGHLDYLTAFCQRCDLSRGLVEELMLLYRQHIGNRKQQQQQQQHDERETRDLADRMRYVISNLTNVEAKCSLYSQLNLDEAREQLLKSKGTRAHLRDLRLA